MIDEKFHIPSHPFGHKCSIIQQLSCHEARRLGILGQGFQDHMARSPELGRSMPWHRFDYASQCLLGYYMLLLLVSASEGLGGIFKKGLVVYCKCYRVDRGIDQQMKLLFQNGLSKAVECPPLELQCKKAYNATTQDW